MAWTRHTKDHIWLMSPARIAVALGCGRLCGQPVKLPVNSLLGRIKAVRAAFLAAWHAGRKYDDPITRKSIRSATGVPESTQREYDAVAGTYMQMNLSLQKYDGDEQQQEAYWQHGRGVFKFFDRSGRAGPKGGVFLAERMANSYLTKLEQAAPGRLKKVNRAINLVNKAARGKHESRDRIYYQDSAQAGKAYDRDPSHDHYFRLAKTIAATTARKPKLASHGLWSCIPATT